MANINTIAVASDHGGFELKKSVLEFLKAEHAYLTVSDLGAYTTDSVDYPDFADQMANAILSKKVDAGILICGTGIGISIRANRYKGIRAALVHDEFTAEMAKVHNNANVLCLGGRTTSPEQAKALVDIWLNAAFEGGRHQRRLDKLDA